MIAQFTVSEITPVWVEFVSESPQQILNATTDF
jgi:hypothetical protein